MRAQNDHHERLAKLGVIPVLALDAVGQATPLAEALKTGGLPCAEVTFRTAAAVEAIAKMSEVGGLEVGAGTVTTPEQVEAAAAAGATFIVTPGFSRAVVDECANIGLPVYPGIATGTEIQMALDAGITTVKLFPAELLGGLAMLRALSAPYANVRFIPTGGVSPTNLASYLADPAVVAAGGTWIAPQSLLATGDWVEVERRASAAALIVADTRRES